MGRSDRRLAIGAVCGIALTLAATLLIGLHIEPKGSLAQWSQSLAHSIWPLVWHWLRSPGRKGWAIIVQLIGAVVTLFGLWTAWLRATHGETIATMAKRLGRWIWEQVSKILCRCRPRDQRVDELSFASPVLMGDRAVVTMTFNMDRDLSTRENLERLARFVSDLSGKKIPQLENQMGAALLK